MLDDRFKWKVGIYLFLLLLRLLLLLLLLLDFESIVPLSYYAFEQAREMDKRKEGKPGEARAALRRSVRDNGSVFATLIRIAFFFFSFKYINQRTE